MPRTLYVENIPDTLAGSLDQAGSITAGGKRAVVIAALEAFLNKPALAARSSEGPAVDSLREARSRLRGGQVDQAQLAEIVALILDALTQTGPARQNARVSLAGIATARQARLTAAQAIRDVDLANTTLEWNTEDIQQLLTWSRVWLTTAIALSIGSKYCTWADVLEAAERTDDLDRDIELGRLSKLARDWKLEMWRSVPDKYRSEVCFIIRRALNRISREEDAT